MNGNLYSSYTYSGCWFSFKFKFDEGGVVATCVQSIQPIIPGNPVFLLNQSC